MWNGKQKAVTFSYDDGVTQDIRLIEMFDKYGLKGTFNLNSGGLGRIETTRRPSGEFRNTVKEEDVRRIYENHEVAVHTVTHPHITELSDEELLHQVADDQKKLSELCGYDVIGMAYPGAKPHNHNKYVVEFIRKNTTIKYARTVTITHSFDLQDDLLEFNPSAYHTDFDKTFELAKKFIELKTDTPKLFYVMGHSYELDIYNAWDKMEELCKLISGHKDIFYGTNREILLP